MSYLGNVKADVHDIIIAAVPGVNTIANIDDANRINWRQLIEAAQKGGAVEWETPWVIVEFGPAASSDKGGSGIMVDVPLSIWYVTDWTPATDDALEEIYSAIEAIIEALRSYSGGNFTAQEASFDVSQQNAGNVFFSKALMPYVCGQITVPISFGWI